MDVQADVTVGHQRGGIGELVEQVELAGLLALEPDRHLDLADLEAQAWRDGVAHPGVEQIGGRRREILEQAVLEVLEQVAAELEAGTADQEVVVAPFSVIVAPVVGLSL